MPIDLVPELLALIHSDDPEEYRHAVKALRPYLSYNGLRNLLHLRQITRRGVIKQKLDEWRR